MNIFVQFGEYADVVWTKLAVKLGEFEDSVAAVCMQGILDGLYNDDVAVTCMHKDARA